MEFNSIDSLPEDFLGGLAQLQYIRMSHNLLKDKGIPSNTFNVTGLVELDLSYNKLERIPTVSTTLQHLYLQANQIKGKWPFRHIVRKLLHSQGYFTSHCPVIAEFSLGSFCSVVDVTNFSRLQTLRLDGNEISQEDIPSESALCLRWASSIQI